MAAFASKIHHVDASVPKSWATQELATENQQVGQAAVIEVARLNLSWQGII